ncbi:non-muscle cofilin 1-like [Clinocottus analis]|uniref:non-muscle cofilin 1-like n=1 Tax=Clinocottus analis TaxID=304258 RepID=UPI0035C0A9ED
MSGVRVSDDVKLLFNKMKVVKSSDAEEDRIRLVILHIEDEIKVEKCYVQKDLEGKGDVFKFLQSLLLKDECRYILYDCHFETKESSKKEELVYIMWAPATAKIKSKMQYASSKTAIDSVVQGVKHKLQINDLSDIDRVEFAEKLGNPITLEGHSI